MRTRIALCLAALLTICTLCSCGAGVHISVGTPGNNSFEWGFTTPGGDSYGNAPAPGNEQPEEEEAPQGA